MNERKIGVGIMCGQSNDEFTKLCDFHKINIGSYKGNQSKTKIARNLVDYQAGKTILQTALNAYESNNVEQQKLF